MIGHDCVVHFDDLAFNRCFHFGGSLHRFDDCGIFLRREFATDFRLLNIDEVPEFVLRERSDADGADIALHLDVFVVFGVAGGHDVSFGSK